MMIKLANYHRSVSASQIVIIFLLSALVSAAVGNVLISDTSNTIIQSPSGSSIQLNMFWQIADNNHYGTGAHWLCGSGHCLFTAPGDTITLISNFHAYCTVNSALIQLRAENDDGLTVYLNNALILSTTGSSSDLSQTISLNCGVNQLKVVLQNHQLGGMGVVFSITQEQNGCNNCCTDNMPLCITCQSTTYCNTCVAPASTLTGPSTCSYCSSYLPNCLACSSITYCTSCSNSSMIIATNHSQCNFCNYYLPNCSTCTSDTYCTACITNLMFLVTDHSACHVCIDYLPNCATCTSQTYCTACINNLMLLAADHLACYACIDYLPNCATCTSETYCTSCLSSAMFILANHTACHSCTDYIPNCATCLSQTLCTICNNLSLFVSITQDHCLVCNQYIPDCFICASETSCSFYKNSTFYLTSNHSLCLPCSSALSNCLECLSESVCFTCNNSTVLYMNSICKYCRQVFPYCLSCNNVPQCLQCQQFITIISDNKKACQLCNSVMEYCHLCSNKNTCYSCYLGSVVIGGCSSVIGCIQVQQVQGLNSFYSRCINCNSTIFYLDAVSNLCVCKIGKLIGDYCYSGPGCVATQMVAGVVICLSCQVSQNFVLNNITKLCQCTQGFFLFQNVCADICGDGKIFTNDCDDGNTNDGDGCSSACKVESKYTCTNNGSGPSVCQLSNNQIKVQLISVKRDGKLNRGIFIFDFFSAQTELEKFNIEDYFSFSCQQYITAVQWQLKEGKVIAFVDYSEDLQDNIGMVNFTFNQLFIHHEPITLQFLMHSQTLPLIFQEQSALVNILDYIFFGISLAALFLLFVGSWAHKMVGVELIHPLQIIYFIHFAFKKYISSVGCYQYLSYVGLTGNDILLSNSKQNIVVFQDYQKIEFGSLYFQYTLIILASPFVISSICIVISFVLPKLFLKFELLKIFKIIKKIYQGFIFPAVFGFIFLQFLALDTLASHSISSTHIFSVEVRSGIIFMMAFFSSFLFQNQFKCLVTKQTSKESLLYFSEAQMHYIPIYQLYSIAQLIVLWLWIKLGYSSCAVVMLLITILMFIWQLIFRPYNKALDNVSICFNSTLLIVFLIFFLVRNRYMSQGNMNFQIIFSLAIAGLSLACVMLSFARVLRALCCSTSQSQKVDEKPIKSKQILQQDDMSLKRMTEIYVSSFPYQRQMLLNENGQFMAQKFIKAYSQDKKLNPELLNLIQKKIQKRIEKKKRSDRNSKK